MLLSTTGLFSATQTEAVGELARAGLRNPVRVKVAVRPNNFPESQDGKNISQKTPLGLTIRHFTCESTEKLGHLLNFLKVNCLTVTRDNIIVCGTLQRSRSLIVIGSVVRGIIGSRLSSTKPNSSAWARLA